MDPSVQMQCIRTAIRRMLQCSASYVAVQCIVRCSAMHRMLQCSPSYVAVQRIVRCSAVHRMLQCSPSYVAVHCIVCCSAVHRTQCNPSYVSLQRHIFLFPQMDGIIFLNKFWMEWSTYVPWMCDAWYALQIHGRLLHPTLVQMHRMECTATRCNTRRVLQLHLMSTSGMDMQRIVWIATRNLTHMNESYHTYVCIAYCYTQLNTYEWVISHICMHCILLHAA